MEIPKKESNKLIKNIKKSWKWVWHSDSIWSWIAALILIYVFIKLIFFPGLSLIFGTSLPLAGVESSSMDHQIVTDDYNRLSLCGKIYSPSEKEHINFDEYWKTCGSWYEEKYISKQEFSEFPLSKGFSKGDVMIVFGRFTPKVGDVIIFNAEGSSPRPIIHRIISIENDIIQTKGDHNEKQLTSGNNIYNTDETKITKEQIIGKAVFKIPYLGWPKIILSEIISSLMK